MVLYTGIQVSFNNWSLVMTCKKKSKMEFAIMGKVKLAKINNVDLNTNIFTK